MKKLFGIFVIAFSMIACEGPMGPDGLDGLDGRNGLNGADGQEGPSGANGKDGQDGEGTKWHTHSFSVKDGNWKLVGEPNALNSYYYYDFDFPELTNFVFDEGTIIGYMAAEGNAKNGLPYVLHLGEADNDSEFLWTQTYDFSFAPGKIRFRVTFSDFITNAIPDGETFNVVLMW